MREKKASLVITFATTTAAMAMERVGKKLDLPGRLIPVPRQITASCGLAWKTSPEEKESIIAILEQERISWQEMHILDMWE